MVIDLRIYVKWYIQLSVLKPASGQIESSH